MNLRDIAKALGSRGGKARARNLSPDAKKQIAALGGHARAQSILVAKRIEQNFTYVAVLKELRGAAKKNDRNDQIAKHLPGLYPDEKKHI